MNFDAIKQLFSPPVLAAIRYLLVALLPIAALLGLGSWFDNTLIDKAMETIKQLGVIANAAQALILLLVPILAGFGVNSAREKNQVNRTIEISKDPTSPNQAAASAALESVIAATKQIAEDPNVSIAPKAKDALISATVSLPEVDKIIAAPATAQASPSNDVISSDQVKVIENASGLEIKS